MNTLTRSYTVDARDFSRAGEASGKVKQMLKSLGFPPDVVRRTAISAYEAEINMVIHANGGVVRASITPEAIEMVFEDSGPGIPDVSLAMQEGWSTAPQDVRALGFGAGMGLPNIRKYTDDFTIETKVGVGTTLRFRINVGEGTA